MVPSLFRPRHQNIITARQNVQVYLVLEEDGTEVDDEEYFQTLPDNTMFMLLLIQVSPAKLWSTEFWFEQFVSKQSMGRNPK